jgi:hypothetical protein
MNTRGLLDQLLKSGQDLMQQKAGGASAGGLGGLGGLGACRTFYPFRALKVSATIGALPLGVLADEPLRPC